jgi:hypothetical protein
MGDGSTTSVHRKSPMLSIHIIQSGPQYLIHDGSFGNEEGVVVSLKAKGCSQENLIRR